MKKIILSCLIAGFCALHADSTINSASTMEELCKQMDESLPGIKKGLVDTYSVKIGTTATCLDIPNKKEIETIASESQFGILVGLQYSLSKNECGSALYESIVSECILSSGNDVGKIQEIIQTHANNEIVALLEGCETNE